MSQKVRGEVHNSLGVTASVGLSLVHVIASLDGKAAGPSYSVPRLCEELSELGHTVSLLSATSQSEPVGEHESKFEDRRYPLQYASIPALAKLGVASGLRDGLLAKALTADIFHVHGLWRLANVYPAAAARRGRKPMVLTTRGMLAHDALEFSSLSKRLFWAAAQREAVMAVSAFHATSDQEYADIRSFGLGQPVAIIPNGIDLPGMDLASVGDTAPTVVFLGRLHPVKAIDRLIKAWHLLGEASQGWHLRIVGPVEMDYDKYLRNMATNLSLTNISFHGPTHGTEKWQLLRDAEVTVLPSLSENFGISVAESLAAGTPVIASRGTPWEGLKTYGCGWWVDNSPEALADALHAAMLQTSSERAAMGQRGREWVQRDFSWTSIAAKMVELYSWLSGGGMAPSFLRFE